MEVSANPPRECLCVSVEWSFTLKKKFFPLLHGIHPLAGIIRIESVIPECRSHFHGVEPPRIVGQLLR